MTNSDNRLGYIRLATKEDGEQLYRLRVESYSNSKQFEIIHTDFLRWSNKDDAGKVLCIFDVSGQMIATMRANYCENIEALQDVDMDFLTSEIPVFDLPAMFLSCAATKLKENSTGLNTLLRATFFRNYLNSVKTVVGMVYKDAARIKTMREMGYMFTVYGSRRDGVDFNDKEQTVFAFLTEDKFEVACNYLTEKSKELLKQYPIL